MSPSSKTGTIEQEIDILGATPHDVFELLMDAQQHAALTGGEAKISRKVGGAFIVFDGWASGVQRELVQDATIVQTWRADDWPEGSVSTCTYQFKSIPGGTRIHFLQTEVPKAFVKTVGKGWHQYYWKPMQKMFAA